MRVDFILGTRTYQTALTEELFEAQDTNGPGTDWTCVGEGRSACRTGSTIPFTACQALALMLPT